ncbi:D-alanyl-D-alanine carboxypeptidase family protein [Anaerotignum sp. MB30-C6]|uniref:D-alanyl-D-alanine carboxypeptidase family protein n=1 Tax=Anaerotignum sp. MB30-C6 TaxID=3070814 RepID=UPI0027DDD3AF|nr:D-alanyl-D-alanine carboxypeptidase family protein [Anaerotignum sp. MB30-C6]WMI80333.1 D-alanyl-D-alanine carboxypeptidase family protein [Anaerotignum sp. MB30-C6]
MKKRILAAVTAFFCFLAPFSVCAEEGSDSGLQLQSKSAVLMEQATGTVIYEKNSHEAMPLASVTKVMTLLLIYEAQADGKFAWTDSVQISDHAASMGGSQVFLEPGETQTAADLTKCIAIASANDAAVAMAEFVAGSEEGFVEKMNERAKELGMEDSVFVNACGLDADGHVSSAYDIALMSRELMKNFPEIKEYTTTWMDTITHKTRKGETEFGLTNTNKLIKWYEGATGLKTGSTGKALYCLSGTAERNGLSLIGVVMAAPDFRIRFQEVMKLLDHGFANYTVEKGYPIGQDMGLIPVEKGMKEGVNAVVKDEISVLMGKGSNGEWETKTELLPSVKAPIAQGTKVGEMIYTLDGKEVGRTDLVALEAVDKASIHMMLERMMKLWC